MKIGRDSNGDNYHSGAYPKVIQADKNLSKNFKITVVIIISYLIKWEKFRKILLF